MDREKLIIPEITFSAKAIKEANAKYTDVIGVLSKSVGIDERIDLDYSRVDYKCVCDDVFYCDVDDLDLD